MHKKQGLELEKALALVHLERVQESAAERRCPDRFAYRTTELAG
jgi:hypothetical protein